MYLKQLKLAGFKSFVDPITIPLQGALVAVVGPNGCGKSNIIDAVRWVMGESSAKSLRGESMIDVIFNGSSQRKALGQASVELVFDNSRGLLSGQYGSYQEIAVKRVVSRDGDSSYFLNGTRCRRRDITDIFLGTGAGARGYSIIGQGTISRLIEARPDELKAYLDEAAGISKYKERRRETVQRIAATRENLVRVTDIRDELAKQLHRLEQQANTANRYKTLCAEEKRLKAEILVLKWQQFERQREQTITQRQQLQLTLTSHQTEAVTAYQQQTDAQLKITEETDAQQTLQTHFYQLNADIARLEEHFLQQQREKQRVFVEHEQLQGDYLQLSQQIQNDTTALQHHREDYAGIQIQVDHLRTQWKAKQEQLESLQEQGNVYQDRLAQLQQALSATSNSLSLAQTHVTHHHQRIQDIKSRLQTIISEQAALQLTSVDFDLSTQKALQISLQDEVTQSEAAVHETTIHGKNIAEQQVTLDKALQQQKDKVYQLTTQLAALHAWIATALGRNESAGGVAAPDWKTKTRLVEVIQVEQAWQVVCEMVLAEVLQGVIVEDLAVCTQKMPHQMPKQGIFVTPKILRKTAGQFPRLIDKIDGIHPNYTVDLEKIYAAQDWNEALVWLPKIADDESIVTQEGYWLGHGWLRIFDLDGMKEVSVLARQEEQAKLTDDLRAANLLLATQTASRDAVNAEMVENNQKLSVLQSQLSTHRDNLRHCLAELANQQYRMEQVSVKTVQLTDEQEQLQEKLEALFGLLADSDAQVKLAQTQHDTFKEEQNLLNQEYTVFQENLKPYQQAVQDLRKNLHEIELNRERAQLKVEQLQVSLQRDESRLTTLQARLASVSTSLRRLEQPDDSLQEELTRKLLHRQELEHSLHEKREQIDILNDNLKQFVALNKDAETQANAVKEAIQQTQIEEQVLAAKAAGVLEALNELGAVYEESVQTISAEASIDAHEEKLLKLVEKIKRLGPINLAAIDEYDIESERKKYLDQQNYDLMEALQLLETAITKIDKEMQQRFQMMFTEVNHHFQTLFPRLFGGGHAALELTCDNLLETGVIVMAQPPGKRNSTIHLLSGGEKAMTAVALIFAIFQLNPSPFCMLDEVDAPLDDVNVGRFCALMKEMAGLVQFLFITHNKNTMLLAEQLIGVTMREPGVSRIVAVDVEQALLMSETV